MIHIGTPIYTATVHHDFYLRDTLKLIATYTEVTVLECVYLRINKKERENNFKEIYFFRYSVLLSLFSVHCS